MKEFVSAYVCAQITGDGGERAIACLFVRLNSRQWLIDIFILMVASQTKQWPKRYLASLYAAARHI
jgi:hypothetical protein